MSSHFLPLFLLAAIAVAARGEEGLHLSVRALPSTSSSGLATGPYQAQEGIPCQLEATLKNNSETPLILANLAIEADGDIREVSPLRQRRPTQFHGDAVWADSLSSSESGVRVRWHWVFFESTESKSSWPASRFLSGTANIGYHWVTTDGILLPGKHVSIRYPWLPLRPDGGLDLRVTARVTHLVWKPELQTKVLFPDPRTPLPSVPEWLRASVGPSPRPSTLPVERVFNRLPGWSETTDFSGAIVRNGPPLPGTVAQCEKSGSIRIRPGLPPLSKLIPQCPFPLAAAVYSPALKAWFLQGDGQTLVVARGQRFELKTDVSDFLTTRLFTGKDANPWVVTGGTGNGIPEEFRRLLSSYDRTSDGNYQVSIKEMLARFVDLDRLDFCVGEDGAVLSKRSGPR